ncbi:hypothetical protein [Streptomyces sp. B3I8]|uniref:hypothetical protein n=1 Tax=unclassified Streptomyces TaxID=2593676 RepID=UPI0035902C79
MSETYIALSSRVVAENTGPTVRRRYRRGARPHAHRPLGYLTRPYLVHRSRDDRLGNRPPRRGWERVG